MRESLQAQTFGRTSNWTTLIVTATLIVTVYAVLLS